VNKLFLVRFGIIRHSYNGTRSFEEDMRIVWAKDNDAARRVVIQAFRSDGYVSVMETMEAMGDQFPEEEEKAEEKGV
jgi:hypothetical protein